jgi:hypothetical protein
MAGQAVLRCSPSPDLISISATLDGLLSKRAWVGDAELIVELGHVRNGTTSALSLLQVELDDLGDAIDQSPASVSYVDLTSGVVWPAELFEVGQEPDDFDADDSNRWLPVVGAGRTPCWSGSSPRSRTPGSPHDCGMGSAGRSVLTVPDGTQPPRRRVHPLASVS